MDISLTALEHAINDWRARKPSTGEEHTLSPEVNALAGIYAMMIYHRETSIALAAFDPFPRQVMESWLAAQVQAEGAANSGSAG